MRCGGRLRYASSFPPNFSQLRHELELAEISNRSSSGQPLLRLPGRGLELNARSEDLGDEFPVQFDPMTVARTQELAFEQQIRALKKHAAPDATIILAATEVRDRLFLARRLRSEMPAALLVDMEADILLTHPDYIDATRGMLVISSAEIMKEVSSKSQSLSGSCDDAKNQARCQRVFPTDDTALLYRLIKEMVDAPTTEPKEGNAVWLYQVTRHGFNFIKRIGVEGNTKQSDFYDRFLVIAILLLPLVVVLFRGSTGDSRNPMSTLRFKETVKVVAGKASKSIHLEKLQKIELPKLFLNLTKYATIIRAIFIIIFLPILAFSLAEYLAKRSIANFWPSATSGLDIWSPLVTGSLLLCWFAYKQRRLFLCPPWPFVPRLRKNDFWANISLLGLAAGVLSLLNLAAHESFSAPAAVDWWVSFGLTALTVATTLLVAVVAHSAALQFARLKHGLAALDLYLVKTNNGYRPWSDFVDHRTAALDGMGYSSTPFAIPARVGPRCPDNYQLETDDTVAQYSREQDDDAIEQYKHDQTEQPHWASRCVGLLTGYSVTDFVRWPDNLTNRMALRRILSREISQLRWLCMHTIFLAAFGVFSAVAFPIGALNTILSINVFYVCVVAIAVAWITIDLDRNALLAMLFNGTPGKIDWRTSFVTYLVVPIIIVTLAIWAANVPGVRQWSEHAARSIFSTIGLK